MRPNRQIWPRLITGIIFFSFLVWLGFFTDKIADENDHSVTVSNNNSPAAQTDLSSSQTTSTPPPIEIKGPVVATKPASLPTKINIFVPYTLQAPFSVWDPLHEDACEEASLLMVKHFLDKTKIDSKQAIENEIIDLVNFEEEKGYGTSITLAELATIAKDKYGMTGIVKQNITNIDIKKEIALGKPVIVGAAGKILPNPYFRNGGPIYHMLVIKGFNSTNFITNDPGTMKGDGFEYSYADLYNSIHDWDPVNIMNGKKNYLVF